jgi:hypothetical protein
MRTVSNRLKTRGPSSVLVTEPNASTSWKAVTFGPIYSQRCAPTLQREWTGC